MCRITSHLHVDDRKGVLDAPLMRRKYQELDGKPINLVRYELNWNVGGKFEGKKQQQIFTDQWLTSQTSISEPQQIENVEQFDSESPSSPFESFYNIPNNIGSTEYDFENDFLFYNSQYLALPPYQDANQSAYAYDNR